MEAYAFHLSLVWYYIFKILFSAVLLLSPLVILS